MMLVEFVNPFPLEAVAAYGDQLRTCELGYMREPKSHLDDYLASYFRESTRYGGTIPLRGSHGSGKTHLLGWLARQARERQRSSPTVVYGMVDRASFFDLFSQIIGQLPQDKLQDLIGAALQQQALEEVQKATITTDLRARLDSPGALADLATEGNVDRNELLRQLTERLQKRMEEKKVPREIPLALMKIDSPIFGERAYQWLQGKRVEGLEELGLAHHLGELAQDAEGSSVPEVAAINAVETIAALHQFAQRPFVILIDQLEVFVRDIDKEKRQMLASLIRKLMEQLGRQNALTFIAGADDAWSALPRDVTPRMRVREPLRVGNLQPDETRMLLESFTEGGPQLSRESLDHIYHLSGGNPREILRIGYQAYQRLGGALDQAKPDDLIASAQASGTVEDRTRVALGIAERVLGAYGSVSPNLDIDEGLVLDRLVLIDHRPALALSVVKATDQISEVRSARLVPAITDYIGRTWPGVPLIAVTIGYSSTPVTEQLERAAAVLDFDEETFESQLRGRVVHLLAERPAAPQAAEAPAGAVLDALQDISRRLKESPVGPAGPAGPMGPPAPSSASDPVLLTTLTRIVNRLDELENVRKGDVERKFESFAERTAISAEPAQRRRELRTRWDLLDGLQELHATLGRPGERECIRAILVANESFLKNQYLDLLGGKYLDLLDGIPDDSGGFETRVRLIREMRRTLRQRSPLDLLAGQPLKYSSFAGAIALVVFLAWRWLDSGAFSTAFLSDAVMVGATATAYTFATAWLVNFLRARRWRL